MVIGKVCRCKNGHPAEKQQQKPGPEKGRAVCHGLCQQVDNGKEQHPNQVHHVPEGRAGFHIPGRILPGDQAQQDDTGKHMERVKAGQQVIEGEKRMGFR